MLLFNNSALSSQHHDVTTTPHDFIILLATTLRLLSLICLTDLLHLQEGFDSSSVHLLQTIWLLLPMKGITIVC